MNTLGYSQTYDPNLYTSQSCCENKMGKGKFMPAILSSLEERNRKLKITK